MKQDDLVRAIDLALEGDWEGAHQIVRNYEDASACWIHAVLHRIEGDDGNSRYWYNRAGRSFSTSLTDREELHLIKSSLK